MIYLLIHIRYVHFYGSTNIRQTQKPNARINRRAAWSIQANRWRCAWKNCYRRVRL